MVPSSRVAQYQRQLDRLSPQQLADAHRAISNLIAQTEYVAPSAGTRNAATGPARAGVANGRARASQANAAEVAARGRATQARATVNQSRQKFVAQRPPMWGIRTLKRALGVAAFLVPVIGPLFTRSLFKSARRDTVRAKIAAPARRELRGAIAQQQVATPVATQALASATIQQTVALTLQTQLAMVQAQMSVAQPVTVAGPSVGLGH